MKQFLSPQVSSHPLPRSRRRKKPCSALSLLSFSWGRERLGHPSQRVLLVQGFRCVTGCANVVCWCPDLLGEDALTNHPLPSAEPALGRSLRPFTSPCDEPGLCTAIFFSHWQGWVSCNQVAPLVWPRVNLSACVIRRDSLQTSSHCN